MNNSSNTPASLVETSCAYCGVGCGIDIHVKNGKAEALNGSADHPANYGKLCVKGSNLLATTTADNRLLAPEIAGKQVSWQQATSFVASELNRIISQYGKNSVAFYVSGQLLTEDYYVANKLMKGYIGSGNIDTNSRLCMSSAVSAYKRAFGEDIVPCNYQDLETTELLLITGSNAAWTHPILFQRIERAKKINPAMKVVVIDPRKTATAQVADYFLPIKAATDTAFFNGLLHYLNEHNGLDHHFIAQHTEQFDDTLAACQGWSLDAVAQYCQLNINTLESVYQLFARSKRAVTFYSMGINQSSSGTDKCQSIINCHLASGKIGKAGCGPFSITGQPNAMGGREVGGLANQLAAHMDINNPNHQHKVQRFWQSPTIATEEGVKAIDLFDKVASGDIKAVWIMATNPLVSLPDREKIAKALKKCELVIVSDCVANNDTLAFADVKLAARTWLEKEGTVTNSERRISRQRAVEKPIGQARADWQIIGEVAQKMGFSGFDFSEVSEIFDEYTQLTAFENNNDRCLNLSALSHLSAQEYQQLKPIQWPVNEKFPQGCSRVFADNKFYTHSEKAQFIAVKPKLALQQTSIDYPYVLNSGRIRDQWHTMTRTGKASILTSHIDKPYLAIHPDDAKQLGVSCDDLVEISARTGKAIAHVKVDKKQRLGECFMPIHWNEQFASHGVVNQLYQAVVDPISGQAETKHAAVQLTKATFAQYGQLHCVDTLNINSDFWLKNTTIYGMSYQLALKKIVADPLLWAQQTTQYIGEWLQFSQGNNYFIVCLADKKLQCLFYLAPSWPELESAWLEHVFAQSSLSFAQIQALLLGIAEEEFSHGKKICSCFNVRENEINQAIADGCNSVSKLSQRLKCGSNCGSCKPELANLIERFG